MESLIHRQILLIKDQSDESIRSHFASHNDARHRYFMVSGQRIQTDAAELIEDAQFPDRRISLLHSLTRF